MNHAVTMRTLSAESIFSTEHMVTKEHKRRTGVLMVPAEDETNRLGLELQCMNEGKYLFLVYIPGDALYFDN